MTRSGADTMAGQEDQEAPSEPEVRFGLRKVVVFLFGLVCFVPCVGWAALGLASIYIGMSGLAFLAGMPAKYLWTGDVSLEYPVKAFATSVALLLGGVPLALGYGFLTIRGVIDGWRFLRR